MMHGCLRLGLVMVWVRRFLICDAQGGFPSVKGGMRVGTLQISNGNEGGRSSIFFGKENKTYELGMSPDGDFSLMKGNQELMTVSKDDVLRVSTSVVLSHSLDIEGEFLVNGIPQFRMVHKEDYSTGEATGWDNKNSKNIVSQCAGIAMLGGYGKFAEGEVTKKFDGLPSHMEIKIKATFHFIDAWIGETGFMRVNAGTNGNMVHVWTERHSQDLEQLSVNVCGGPVGEGKFATPIEISIPHISDSVVLGFGSTMEGDDAYDQSWGVSGIEIYVR